ncbi:MAG: hypothetical protein ACT4NY_19270 [Pseudonocardiales bacterium]
MGRIVCFGPVGVRVGLRNGALSCGFVCVVAPEDVTELIGRVEQMIDLTIDAVHLLPTCAAWWSGLVVRGQADATPDKPSWAAL